jgi:Fe-Mn family superoxide dismutase
MALLSDSKTIPELYIFLTEVYSKKTSQNLMYRKIDNKYQGISFAEFKEQFSKSALTLFGSGWAWLSKKSDGSLEIKQESNAGNPLRNGLTPILTCDVWEHAYYLGYQNRRVDYIKAFWDILDWDVISKRY